MLVRRIRFARLTHGAAIALVLWGSAAWPAKEAYPGSILTRKHLPIWIQQVMERDSVSCMAKTDLPDKIRSKFNDPNLARLSQIGKAYRAQFVELNTERQKNGLKPIQIPHKKKAGDDATGSIEKPFILSAELLDKKLEELSNAPESFKAFFFEGRGPMTVDLSDEDIVQWAKKAEKATSLLEDWTAWTSDPESPNSISMRFSDMADNIRGDVRAYYELYKKRNGLEKLLGDLDSNKDIGEDLSAEYEPWLSGLCQNNGYSTVCCDSALKLAEEAHRSLDFARFFKAPAEFQWNRAFKIAGGNPDIYSIPDKHQIIVPMWIDGSEDYKNEFKRIVEKAYTQDGWQVVITLTDDKDKAAGTVRKEKGIRSRVEGKHDIFLSADLPLSNIEREVQHEMGHVLGFEDCYHGHADPKAISIVYYELDSNNLMCSLTGSVTDSMMNEIIRTYESKTR